jgi:hypothetical protein
MVEQIKMEVFQINMKSLIPDKKAVSYQYLNNRVWIRICLPMQLNISISILSTTIALLL